MASIIKVDGLTAQWVRGHRQLREKRLLVSLGSVGGVVRWSNPPAVIVAERSHVVNFVGGAGGAAGLLCSRVARQFACASRFMVDYKIFGV